MDFESAEEAERALVELDGKEIGGRPVKIGRGVPKRGKGGDGGGGDARGKEYRVRNWHGGTQAKDGVLWRQGMWPS